MTLHLFALFEWISICLVGCVLAMAMMRKVTCPQCQGHKTLYNTDGSVALCPTCKGAGEVEA